MRRSKLRGAAVLVDRIKRRHPDVYARYLRGEFSSVYAAAVEAGVMRPQLTVPRRPVGRLADALKRHLDDGEIAELADHLTE